VIIDEAELLGQAPEEDLSMPRADHTPIGRWLVETALLLILAFVLAQGLKAFVVQPFVIPTGSMVPTIGIGDYVLAEKLTYRLAHGPQQGDIVVFDDPLQQHPQLIKRVIAIEGQTVEVRDEKVFVDGKALAEPYTNGRPTTTGTISTPLVVPADCVWLMGDNRPNSGDSRYFGSRPVKSVHGRAFWIYWPLRDFGPLK